MKRLLLAFALLFTIPFTTSCIKEIPVEVVVTGHHCTWEKPVKMAIIARTYEIKIQPDEGYGLDIGFEKEGEVTDIVVKTQNAGDITFMLSSDDYNQTTSVLTIPGRLVSSKITIIAEAQEE